MTEQGEYGVGVKPGVDVDQHEFVRWSKQMFNSITVGGQWAVPRSGLIYEKRSETELVLVALADEYDRFQEENGIDRTTQGITHAAQVADHALIAGYMTMAGITVTDETTLNRD